MELRCSASSPTTTPSSKEMVNNRIAIKYLTKIKYLFKTNQNATVYCMYQRLMWVRIGSRPQHCHPKPLQTIIATLMWRLLTTTTPNPYNKCPNSSKNSKAAIPSRQTPSPPPNAKFSTKCPINFKKFNRLLVALSIIIIRIITAPTPVASTSLMMPVVTLLRQQDSLSKRSLSTKKSDLNSTKKSRKWRKRKCVGILSCMVIASMVIHALMHIIMMSSYQSSTSPQTTRPNCAASTKMKATVCMDRDANFFTVFTTYLIRKTWAIKEDSPRRQGLHCSVYNRVVIASWLTYWKERDASHLRNACQYLNRFIIRLITKPNYRKKSKKRRGKAAFLTNLAFLIADKCTIATKQLATRLNNSTIDNTNSE